MMFIDAEGVSIVMPMTVPAVGSTFVLRINGESHQANMPAAGSMSMVIDGEMHQVMLPGSCKWPTR